jgi:hypothetical protein
VIPFAIASKLFSIPMQYGLIDESFHSIEMALQSYFQSFVRKFQLPLPLPLPLQKGKRSMAR